MAAVRRKVEIQLEDRQFRRGHERVVSSLKEQEKTIGRVDKAFGGAFSKASKIGGRMSEAWRYTRASAKAASAFAQEMHGVEAATAETTKEAGRLESAMSGARNWLAGLLAAGGATAAVRYLYDLNSAAETARTSFTTLLGSAAAADEMLQRIADTAARTPFEIPELQDNVRYMLAMGFAADETIPLLEQIGDATASLGAGTEGIERVVRALGQMQQKGKVSAEEIGQLAEVGIGAWKYLADEFGVSIAEVQDKAQKGALDVSRAVQAIADGMGKEFAGGMSNLANTAEGALSTLRDLANQTLRALSAGAFDEFASDIREIRDAAEGVNAEASNGAVQEWADRIAFAYRWARELLQILLQYGPAIVKVVALYTAVRILGGVVATTSRLITGWKIGTLAASAAQTAFNSNLVAGAARMTAFNAVVKANPIGLLVTVLGAAVAALAAFRAATDASRDAVARENDELRQKLDLLRQMPGAQLYARDQEARDTIRGAGERLRDIRAERQRLLRERGAAPEINALGGGGTSRRGRIDERLAQLAEQEAEAQRQINGALNEQAVIQNEISNDIEDRLGFINEEIRRRTAATEITAAEQQEIQRLQSEAASLQRTLDSRRNTGGGGGGSTKPTSTRAAENAAEKSAERRIQLEEAVVEAKRELETDAAIHANALAQERLRQDRARAESTIALHQRTAADEVRAAQTAAAIRAELDAEEIRLLTEAADLREKAAIEAADREERVAISRANRTVKNAAERQAAISAARAQAEQERTEATREAEQERARIQTRAADLQIDRERSVTEATIEEVEERANALRAMMRSVQEVQPPDVGSTALANDPAIKAYLDGLRSARAALEAGIITQGAFNERVEALRAPAEAAFQAIVQRLVSLGLVTEEAAAKIAELSGEISDGPEVSKWEKLGEVLHDVAGTLDAASGFADALGDRGSSSLLRDYAGMVGASGNFAKSAATGDVAGMVQASLDYAAATADLIRGINARREQAEREIAAADAARVATERNTDALLSQGQVGAAINREMLAGVGGLLAEARAALSEARVTLFGTSGYSEAQDQIALLLQELGGRGIDLAGFESEFRTLLDISDPRERRSRLNAMLSDLESYLSRIGESLGTYGDDVQGALAEFSDALRFLGLEGADAVREFVRVLQQSRDDLGDLGPILGQLEGASEDDVASLVAAAFEQIREGSFDFGTLSPDEVLDILEEALSLTGAGSLAGDAPRDAAAIRSLTYGQGDRLLTYQAEQLRVLRAIEAHFGTGAPTPAEIGRSVLDTGGVSDALHAALRENTRATEANTAAMRGGTGLSTRGLSRALATDARLPKAPGNRS